MAVTDNKDSSAESHESGEGSGNETFTAESDPSTSPESSVGGYRQVVRATSIIGGASVFTIIIGIARNKITALLLGPTGVGLSSQYVAATSLLLAISKCGTDISGVRQIAAARSSENEEEIGRTIFTLRRIVFLLGLAGTIVMILLAAPLAGWALGDRARAGEIMIVAPIVLFGALAAGHMTLIRGMRRIGDAARATVLASFIGLLVAVPFFIYLGEKGIAPALLTTSFFGLFVYLYYARKISVPRVSPSLREMASESKHLLSLGFVLMSAGFIQSAAMFTVRSMIAGEFGIVAVGQFSAAFTLSAVYAGYIISAMSADYLPRLSEAIEDKTRFNQMINEQSEIALLLALPGVIGTIAFAPLAILLFYSPDFNDAIGLLRWHVLGVLASIIQWPLGLAIVARNEAKLFSYIQIVVGALHVGLAYLGMQIFGLIGVGIAFAALNVAHFLINLVVVRRLTDFSWSRKVAILLVASTGLAIASFSVSLWTPPLWGYGINTLLCGATAFFCLRAVAHSVGIHSIQQVLARFQKNKP